jgi:hypothetical protein
VREDTRRVQVGQVRPCADVPEDFYCKEVAPANYLLTYTLRQGLRVSRRTTLWRRAPNGWVIVFHQGTVVEAP